MFLKKFFLLIPLLNAIISISGVDDEIYNAETGDSSKKTDLENPCSCDLTEGVCDGDCSCDKDCINLINSGYMDEKTDYSSETYVNKNEWIFSQFCKSYPKTLQDLYNPLVIGFHLFKKGFCLVKDNRKAKEKKFLGLEKNKELSKKYDKEIDKIESDKPEENNFSNVFPTNEIDGTLENKEFKTHEIMNGINFPITLANGLCLFGAYPIKFNQNYEALCSYNIDTKEVFEYINVKLYKKFIVSGIEGIKYYYEIKDSYYISSNETVASAGALKKVRIEIHSKDNKINKVLFNIYFSSTPSSTPTFPNNDLIFSLQFLSDEKDYLKSGNPGYIKGKKILIGEKSELSEKSYSYINLYKEGSVIPLASNKGECKKLTDIKESGNIFYYYDNFIDNIFSFEDTIIFGCKKNVNSTWLGDYLIYNIINTEKKEVISFGQFGNANIRYKNDWKIINNDYWEYWEKDEKECNTPVIFGIYKEKGAVNNTQYQIDTIKFKCSKVDDEDNNRYFISKFLKLNNTKTKWWYAPGPGFIKLPKNIMYPFQIGTTTYREKD